MDPKMAAAESTEDSTAWEVNYSNQARGVRHFAHHLHADE